MAEATLRVEDNQRLMALCGPANSHLIVIEDGFGVKITDRGNDLLFHGDPVAAAQAADALRALERRIAEDGPIDVADVEAAVRLSNGPAQLSLLKGAELEIRTKKKTVKPRTQGQNLYVAALQEHELVFGVGPAGSGKTYLAVAMGVAMMAQNAVDKLILSRPAVEAGERLGFLPGDMKEKIDPYLRPLYDAIADLWPNADLDKLRERGKLEVAPLAFMRGRTLSNAFIVLDEAQNTTEMQMKMFLTRLGENSRMVVTGDPSQVDLPRGVRSGLRDALRTLQGVDGVGVVRLNETDVVRHPLVGRIVSAYAARDRAESQARERADREARNGAGGRTPEP